MARVVRSVVPWPVLLPARGPGYSSPVARWPSLTRLPTRSAPRTALLPPSSLMPHCLMGESYFERRGCLMNNLTLSGFFDPLPHGIWVVALWNILPSHRRFRKYPCPSYSRESEGPCSSAGVQGAGPLASAERAASPSAEGWREVRREEGNASQFALDHRSVVPCSPLALSSATSSRAENN